METKKLPEGRSGLTCENCNYEGIDVHRTNSLEITYCQNCGHTKEEKKDPPPKEPWKTMSSMVGRKPQNQNKGAITHLIPLPEKKKKKR